MKEIVESYFAHRSMVNHQLASYDDCIPIGDGKGSRMEDIVKGIRIGSDDALVDVPVGEDAGGMIKLDVLDKEIYIRMKGIRLGAPTVREANGAEHPATPLECRLRKLTYFSPIYMDSGYTEMICPHHPRIPTSALLRKRGFTLETSQLWSDQEGVTYIQITSRELRRSR